MKRRVHGNEYVLTDGVSFFCWFLFLSSPPKYVNHFKKREREEGEDVVICAFICSNTGETSKRDLSGFPQDDILGTRNHKHLARRLRELFNFFIRGVLATKEEELSFSLASVFACRPLVEYANVREQSAPVGFYGFYGADDP